MRLLLLLLRVKDKEQMASPVPRPTYCHAVGHTRRLATKCTKGTLAAVLQANPAVGLQANLPPQATCPAAPEKTLPALPLRATGKIIPQPVHDAILQPLPCLQPSLRCKKYMSVPDQVQQRTLTPPAAQTLPCPALLAC